MRNIALSCFDAFDMRNAIAFEFLLQHFSFKNCPRKTIRLFEVTDLTLEVNSLLSFKG